MKLYQLILDIKKSIYEDKDQRFYYFSSREGRALVYKAAF